MDTETLRLLERDYKSIEEELEEHRREIQRRQQRVGELLAERAALSPAINLYRAKLGVDLIAGAVRPGNGIAGPAPVQDAPVQEAVEDSAPGPIGAPAEGLVFSEISDTMRTSIVVEYLGDVLRFRKIGEILEDLQAQYHGVTRHNLRTVLERLIREGVLAQLRYGDSKRYVAYGLMDFIEVFPDGTAWIYSEEMWPEMHSSMNKEPEFDWKGKSERVASIAPQERTQNQLEAYGNN